MKKGLLIITFLVTVVAAATVSALLVDIYGKKQEARQYPLMNLKVSDEEVDFEKWGTNFPSEKDGYLKTSESTEHTWFGGSLPFSKIIRYPQLTRLWAGYPFSADYNQKRGHYYAQIDQMATKRNNKEWLNAHGFPKFKGQPGACMNCHSGWTPKLIRDLGWEAFNKTPYVELVEKLTKEHGDSIHGAKLGGTCADCHSPDDMSLRVTRPAYINAMVGRGYTKDEKHGIAGTRQEMRSHVCQQCHVEYYFKKDTFELTFPWAMWPKDQPLKIEMIEQYYDAQRSSFPQDWVHKETGAPMLKMQHPETELFSSGVHARSGVSCADCHMPYKREGAVKVTDHHIRSPLFNVENSCQACHPMASDQLKNRVKFIQQNNASALRMTEKAILALADDIVAAKKLIASLPDYQAATTPEEQEVVLAKTLTPAREMQRRASMRWDFIFSENSSGFHSPQEAMRVLSQATELARRGQLLLQTSLSQVGLHLDSPAISGFIPDAQQPISDAQPPVGQVPPQEVLDLDRSVPSI